MSLGRLFFLQARDMSVVRSVSIQHSFLKDLAPEVRDQVLKALCDMPQLEKLSIVFPPDMCLDSSWLATLFQGAPKLEQVELCHASLTGDFEVAAKSLKEHASMKEMNFWMMKSMPNAQQLEPLIKVLATLERVVLDWDPPECEFAHPPSWEELLDPNISMLKSLVIGQVHLPDENIRRMSRALHDNHTLTELGLCGCRLSDAAGMALGRMLQYNTTLSRLHLAENPDLGDRGFVAIATGLQYNSKLRVLDLAENPGVTSRGYQALLDTLRHSNATLECISTDMNRKEEEELNFYLRLNRLGRKYILRNDRGSRATWVGFLAKNSDDLGSLWYYISANPGICTLQSDLNHGSNPCAASVN